MDNRKPADARQPPVITIARVPNRLVNMLDGTPGVGYVIGDNRPVVINLAIEARVLVMISLNL